MSPLMALFALSFTVVVLVITRLLFRGGGNGTKGLNLPPGTMGWPFIGDTLAYRKPHACTSVGDYIEQRVHKYGKIYSTNLFGSPTVVSADAELNRFVMMNDEKLFVPSFPKTVAAILGENSMLVITGDMHRSMKSLAVNFMGIARLRNYFLGDAERFIKETFSSWKDNTPFPVKDEASKVTFSLMVKNILSINPGDPGTEHIRKLYKTFMNGLVAIPLNLPVTAYGKAVRARKQIMKAIEELMNERIRKRKEGTDEIREMDVLGFCLDNASLDAQQFGDLMLGLLFGGHETSATAIAMSIYFLHGCPKAVEHLRDEHREIVSKKKERGEPAALTWEDYRQMEFSQCVASETLRLGNIIKGVHRKSTRNIKFKGYDIPKGWNVIPILSAAHLDPAVYENPQSFNPWRWQAPPSEGGTARLDNYMPFGLGLRNCAGLELAKMEMVVFLHHLVLNFDWEVLENEPVPLMLGIPEFHNGLPIRVHRRLPLE